MMDVEILLATYRPNMNYFQKLLRSIEAQSYRNISLSIADDSADEKTYSSIVDVIREELKAVPFTVYKNSENLGSTKTFERLTRMAEGRYLAYCDQDDIWEPDKIAKLVRRIEDEQATMCYSDLSVIDEWDKKIADSFTSINRRVRHVQGDGLFKRFLRRNSVTGCTMLVRRHIAQQALPFQDRYYIHDHWVALIAASAGRIAYVHEPLVRYRIHDNNQIGNRILVGVSNKHDYLSQKLRKEAEKFEYLLSCDAFEDANEKTIRDMLRWVNVRIGFFEKRSLANFIRMLGALHEDPQLIVFELLIALVPDAMGRAMIRAFK